MLALHGERPRGATITQRVERRGALGFTKLKLARRELARGRPRVAGSLDGQRVWTTWLRRRCQWDRVHGIGVALAIVLAVNQRTVGVVVAELIVGPIIMLKNRLYVVWDCLNAALVVVAGANSCERHEDAV